jgi:trehalose 6-phosphate phosphatase
MPGAVEVLERLAAHYAVVGVVSGRPVTFLAEHLPADGVVLSGLYGLEEWRDGSRHGDQTAEQWRPVVERVADRAEVEAPLGVVVERKGLSVTFHFRTAGEQERTLRTWAAEVAAEAGLAMYEGRRSYELRPPVAADKGTAAMSLARGLSAVCFVGDDRGDLAAFAALDAMAAADASVTIVRVAVRSDEAPPELLAAADLIVDGPREALAVLRLLADLDHEADG